MHKEFSMHTALRPLALALLLGQALPAQAGTAISTTRPVASNSVISIEVVQGQVSISGHDAAELSINGTLSEAAEGYILRESAGSIHFEEIIERRSNRWWSPGHSTDGAGAVLDIRVPRGSVLRFTGNNAELDLAGLAGNTTAQVIEGRIWAIGLEGVARLHTINGDIHSEGLNGRMVLETINGNIDDRNSGGRRASFSTVNGSIRSDNRSPRISASNVNGEITLDLHPLDELEVSSISGSIDIFAILNEGAQLAVSSVDGRVDLSLPPSTSASFHLATAEGGHIHNELSAAEPVQKNRELDSHELDFSSNGGSGNVDVSTVSGTVTLHACSAEQC